MAVRKPVVRIKFSVAFNVALSKLGLAECGTAGRAQKRERTGRDGWQLARG